jgi:hypothetical protein
MYRQQIELVAQLHETRAGNEHLAAVNSELNERIASLSEA